MMEDYTRALELTIRFEAERRGLTMQDLMKKTGIKTTTFNERLKGKRSWTLEEIARIAEVFGMSEFSLLEAAQHEKRNLEDINAKPAEAA